MRRLRIIPLPLAIARLIRARDIADAIADRFVGEHPAEEFQGGERLVVGDFVAGFVDAQEGEVAVLAHFAVFGAVDGEGGVVAGAELRGVGVIYGEGDGLAAEPLCGGVVSESFLKDERGGCDRDKEDGYMSMGVLHCRYNRHRRSRGQRGRCY
jgi:hypothetical protein